MLIASDSSLIKFFMAVPFNGHNYNPVYPSS